jgi:GT2 family glycosyltransferase
LLNSDAFLQRDALRLSVEKMDHEPQVGLAGARLIGRDGSWQPSSRMFPSVLNDLLALSGLAAKYPRSRFFGRFDRTWADQLQAARVDWVPGAYSIIRRDLLQRIGYFDERFFLYYEEVDLCRRIKAAGYDVCYWPDVVVIHLGGESSKTLKRLSISSSGRQLTLWRMRAAFLYYRKYQGFAGAFAALRHKDPDSLAKAEEAQLLVATARQAARHRRRPHLPAETLVVNGACLKICERT